MVVHTHNTHVEINAWAIRSVQLALCDIFDMRACAHTHYTFVCRFERNSLSLSLFFLISFAPLISFYRFVCSFIPFICSFISIVFERGFSVIYYTWFSTKLILSYTRYDSPLYYIDNVPTNSPIHSDVCICVCVYILMSFAIHSCVVWCVVRLLVCLPASYGMVLWWGFYPYRYAEWNGNTSNDFSEKCRWLSFSRTFLLANQLIIGLCDCIRWTSIAYSCASFSLAGTIFRFQRHFYFKLDQIDYFEIRANHFPSEWNTLTSFALHISKLTINTVFGRATSFKWIILKTLWKWISFVGISCMA